MTIKIDDNMPSGSFTIMVNGKPEALQSNDLFANNTVALFAVPGAFTPGCSNKHLPGYLENLNELKAKILIKLHVLLSMIFLLWMPGQKSMV